MQPDISGLVDFTDINRTTAYADGGMFSTAQDVARFSQAVLSGEFLQPESLKQMVTFVDEGIPYEGEQYGLGIAKFQNGQVWGKGGDDFGYSSLMQYLPNQNAVIVALQNQAKTGTVDLENQTVQTSNDAVTPIVDNITNRFLPII